MIYNIYSRLSGCINLLNYSKFYLGIYQGYKTPFYYKKEVAIKSFNTQITVFFLTFLSLNIVDHKREAINKWLIRADIRTGNYLVQARARVL